ncbi:MAG: hypothetical protein ACUVTP_04560 [Candidatus Fervidibacter sp.]|uniref:hypothetical protein n=1 Tax=Candidatus Fervidibacter sp. TaxID=3100871 RepID=UPI00404A8C98
MKSGDPTAWKLTTKQGFRSDITCSRRQRIAVGVSANAVFFDGGRNAVLVTRDEHENAWKIRNGLTILPETPCLLIVR